MIDTITCDGCGKTGKPNYFRAKVGPLELGWAVISPNDWLSAWAGDTVYHSCSARCSMELSEAHGWDLSIGADIATTQPTGSA